MKSTLLERFESKIEKTSSCWIWTGALTKNGYGHFNGKRDGMQSNYAHRISWEIYNGLIPEVQQVLHHCDIRACVNPDHLFLGSQQDNINDMSTKNRGWWASKSHCPQGHKYDMVDSRGKRRCKQCVLEYQRAWYATNGRKKGGG